MGCPLRHVMEVELRNLSCRDFMRSHLALGRASQRIRLKRSFVECAELTIVILSCFCSAQLVVDLVEATVERGGLPQFGIGAESLDPSGVHEDDPIGEL